MDQQAETVSPPPGLLRSFTDDLSEHPNRLWFRGVLLLVDTESDRSPHTSSPELGKHCIIMDRAATQAALPSLLGMAVSCKATWDGHNPRVKVGVITAAWISGVELVVEGHIYAWDFPEVEAAVATLDMGMSFDIYDVGIEDMRRKVWTLDRLTFTGAAILLRKDAAFQTTSFTTSRRCFPPHSSQPRCH